MNRSERLLQEALEIKRALIQYLRHPMVEIKRIPDWPWHRVIALQVIVTAVCGALGGLIDHKSTLSILAGLFLSPILRLITLFVSTLFFYYCFQIFAQKTVSLRRLFTIVLFANIPSFIFQILEGYIPPIFLVGMAFTALLLLVGFVENFQLDRKLVIRLISFLYAIVFILWMWNRASSMQMEKTWNFDKSEAPAVELGK